MARLRRIRLRGEEGMATAEYAVATVAACTFGGILVKILSSEEVVHLLTDTVVRAFRFAF